MKVSFYKKSRCPSVSRFVWPLVIYTAILWGITAGISMLLYGLFGSVWNLGFMLPWIAFSGVAGWFAVWRKNYQMPDNWLIRSAVAIILYCIGAGILFLADKMGASFFDILWIAYGLLAIGLIWAVMWPSRSEPVNIMESDQQCIEYPGLVADVAAFQMCYMWAILAFFMCLVTMGISYAVVRYFGGNEVLPYRAVWVCGVFVAFLIFAGGWLVTWRRAAYISKAKRLSSLVITLIFAAITAMYCSLVLHYKLEADYIPFLVIPAYALTAAVIWRRSDADSAAYRITRISDTDFDYTVYCPVCHYNLSGITELRCPECGTEYSIGRLIEQNVYLRNPDLWLN